MQARDQANAALGAVECRLTNAIALASLQPGDRVERVKAIFVDADQCAFLVAVIPRRPPLTLQRLCDAIFAIDGAEPAAHTVSGRLQEVVGARA